jgi:hypothetical protein
MRIACRQALPPQLRLHRLGCVRGALSQPLSLREAQLKNIAKIAKRKNYRSGNKYSDLKLRMCPSESSCQSSRIHKNCDRASEVWSGARSARLTLGIRAHRVALKRSARSKKMFLQKTCIVFYFSLYFGPARIGNPQFCRVDRLKNISGQTGLKQSKTSPKRKNYSKDSQNKHFCPRGLI